MSAMLRARDGVEMTADPAFRARIRRLVGVSAVALGLIAILAAVTLDAQPALELALIAGWVTMPSLLGFSVRRPPLRSLLIVPGGLVSAGLVGICLTALPAAGLARAGWLLITGGVLIGAGLGSWFWYRWFPVPAFLDAPFSAARWILIVVHAVPVVVGLLLVIVSTSG